jgi:hypothetical protein
MISIRQHTGAQSNRRMWMIAGRRKRSQQHAPQGDMPGMDDKGASRRKQGEKRTMTINDLQEITRILSEFAATKFSAQVLEVIGPAQESSKYRWRIVSNRYKEVAVVVATKKSLFGKLSMTGIEVYGLGPGKTLNPDLKELQDFLATAELTVVR